MLIGLLTWYNLSEVDLTAIICPVCEELYEAKITIKESEAEPDYQPKSLGCNHMALVVDTHRVDVEFTELVLLSGDQVTALQPMFGNRTPEEVSDGQDK